MGENQPSLKEDLILEVFKQLHPNRQRVVLEKITREIKKGSIEIDLKTNQEAAFYKFLIQKWPFASEDFFRHAYDVWTLLSIYSTGNYAIGTAEIGDLYLRAKPFTGKKYNYESRPFGHPATQLVFLFGDVFERGKWDHFWICKYEEGDPKIQKVSIVDLMEMENGELNETLTRFGYPILEEAKPSFSYPFSVFAVNFKSFDLQLFARFTLRINDILERSSGFLKQANGLGLFIYCELYLDPNQVISRWSDKDAEIKDLLSPKNFLRLDLNRILVVALDRGDGKKRIISLRDLIWRSNEDYVEALKSLYNKGAD